MRIHLSGVIIIWEWSWEELTDHTYTSDVSSSTGHNAVDANERQRNDYLLSSSDSDEDIPEAPLSSSMKTHIITFKCVGSVHDLNAQEALKQAADLLRKAVTVPLKFVPEPNNQYDSKAIAF